MAEKKSPVAKEPVNRSGENKSLNRSNFVLSALDMSWQLIVVILVPIIGGYELDKVFNSKPVLVLIGFVVAIAASSAVMWLQLKKFSPKITKSDIANAKRLREAEKDDD